MRIFFTLIVIGLSVCSCIGPVETESGGKGEMISEAREKEILTFREKQWVAITAAHDVIGLLDMREYQRTDERCKARLNSTRMDLGNSSLYDYFANHSMYDFREPFVKKDYAAARKALNNEIDFWIVQEAGHSQVPPLCVFTTPERLAFIRQLYKYRMEHDGKVSDLLNSIYRKWNKKRQQDGPAPAGD